MPLIPKSPIQPSGRLSEPQKEATETKAEEETVGERPVTCFSYLTNYSTMIVTMIQVDVGDDYTHLTHRDLQVIYPYENDEFTIDEIEHCMNSLLVRLFPPQIIAEFAYTLYNVRCMGYEYDNYCADAVGRQIAIDTKSHATYYVDWQGV